jgi:hypothetical protein
MGFNKKFVNEKIIEEIILNFKIIELYLNSDVLIFEDEKIKKKFKELRNEFIKTNTVS